MLGRFVAGMAIRMALHRLFAKCGFDDAVAGSAVNFQGLVIAPLGHQSSPRSRPGYRRTSTPVWYPGVPFCQSRWHLTPLPPLSRLFVLFVVVDFGELGIDDVLFFLAIAARTGAAGVASLPLLGGLLVHRLAELHRSLRQRIGFGCDRVGVAALQGLLEVGHGVLDHAAIGVADFRTMLGQ